MSIKKIIEFTRINKIRGWDIMFVVQEILNLYFNNRLKNGEIYLNAFILY